jgi:hypothetical protein
VIAPGLQREFPKLRVTDLTSMPDRS